MAERSDISLKVWKDKFLNGDFISQDTKTQIQAGWYDWFCKDSALPKKTEILGKKAIQLFGSKKLNMDKNYIWFKNNCPMTGPLYDDFRIADRETGDVLFCICNIKKGCYGRDFSGWEVWDFSQPNAGSSLSYEAVLRGDWKSVKAYFGV